MRIVICWSALEVGWSREVSRCLARVGIGILRSQSGLIRRGNYRDVDGFNLCDEIQADVPARLFLYRKYCIIECVQRLFRRIANTEANKTPDGISLADAQCNSLGS